MFVLPCGGEAGRCGTRGPSCRSYTLGHEDILQLIFPETLLKSTTAFCECSVCAVSRGWVQRGPGYIGQLTRHKYRNPVLATTNDIFEDTSSTPSSTSQRHRQKVSPQSVNLAKHKDYQQAPFNGPSACRCPSFRQRISCSFWAAAPPLAPPQRVRRPSE